MLTFLYQLPDIFTFIFFSCLTIVVSVACIVTIRHFIPLDLRYKDNPVIGSMSSLVGIIYGVLASFTALYLINNIGYATDSVQREASACADIVRSSKWLRDPTGVLVQAKIKEYLTEVIDKEWPAMGRGDRVDNAGDRIILQLSNTIAQYDAKVIKDGVVLTNLLQSTRALYDAREQRIEMSYLSLNPDIWFVIIIGTILTIAINFLFEMNFYLHLASIAAAALMTSSMIFLMITLDRPFQGDYVIQPSALQAVLTYIDQDAAKPIT